LFNKPVGIPEFANNETIDSECYSNFFLAGLTS